MTIRNFGGITNHGLNFKAITDHDCIFDTLITNHWPVFDPITDHEKTLYHPVLIISDQLTQSGAKQQSYHRGLAYIFPLCSSAEN